LANDIPGNSDFDLSTLQIMNGAYPHNGYVRVNYTNGTIDYTPNANYVGVDNFVYRVCNLGGFCDTALVELTIIDKPEANPDYATTRVNTPVDIKVAANDFTNAYIPDFASISIPADGYPSFGGVVINKTTGIIKYTPTGSYVGMDTFVYQISTLEGYTDTAHVYVNIVDTNFPPEANLDTASTLEGVAVAINLFDNDVDLDGYLVASSLYIKTLPLNGTVTTTSSDGRIVYTPKNGFIGNDEFIYQVCDNDGACDTARVLIRVLYNNTPPTAIDDNYQTRINTAVIATVLNNDYDIDGNLMYGSLKVMQNPYNGVTLVDTASGTITYSPNTNFSGIDYFTYEICDDDKECAQARVVITISGVNHPPVTMADYSQVEQGGNVEVNVLFNDNDEDNDLDTVSLVIISTPVSGADAQLLGHGVVSFNYAAVPDYYGADTVVYEVCDKVGNCARDTVFINVTPKNQYNLIIPQAFSPNGDGYNDYFEIIGIENYPKNTFTIYNRWGSLIYQAQGYHNQWDGKNGNTGADMPVGTYFMVLDLGEGGKPISEYIYLTR
jgi:gliding motility-associated-like protein